MSTNTIESCAPVALDSHTAAAPSGALEKRAVSLACAIRTTTIHSIGRLARSRSRYSRVEVFARNDEVVYCE